MSGKVQTEIARPANDPATRARAIAYLTRTGNADLMPVLGLTDPPCQRAAAKPGTAKPVRRNGRLVCAACGSRVQADGICRRKRCEAGGAR